MLGKQLNSDTDTIHRISPTGCSLSANINKTAKEPEQLSSIQVLTTTSKFKSLLLEGCFSSASTLTIKYSGVFISQLIKCLCDVCLPKLKHLVFEGNILSVDKEELDLLFQYNNFPVLHDVFLRKPSSGEMKKSDKSVVVNSSPIVVKPPPVVVKPSPPQPVIEKTTPASNNNIRIINGYSYVTTHSNNTVTYKRGSKGKRDYVDVKDNGVLQRIASGGITYTIKIDLNTPYSNLIPFIIRVTIILFYQS